MSHGAVSACVLSLQLVTTDKTKSYFLYQLVTTDRKLYLKI
jgi:hypothetical protein